MGCGANVRVSEPAFAPEERRRSTDSESSFQSSVKLKNLACLDVALVRKCVCCGLNFFGLKFFKPVKFLFSFV